MSNTFMWENLFRSPPSPDQAIAALWCKTPLFQGISLKHARALAEHMHVRHYTENEKIFSAGEIGVGAALILTGKVHIRMGENILAELVRGDFFGEVALVVDEPRTADAFAAETTDVVFFLRPDLDQFIEEYPKMGAQLLLNLTKILAMRLRRANELLMENPYVE